jgi:hypothetical protein
VRQPAIAGVLRKIEAGDIKHVPKNCVVMLKTCIILPDRRQFCGSHAARRTVMSATIGTPAKSKPGQWVQTERKAHEVWARLCMNKPRAAALAHHLVALMGNQNAVVISQKTLAKLMGMSERTVRYAVSDLVVEKWVQVVKLNGPGTVSAYVVNDRVAWGQSRDQLHLSMFSAVIVADIEDQDAATLDHADLRRIPSLFLGEQQLPSGPGEDPPSQPSQPLLPGFEPDLPATTQDS